MASPAPEQEHYVIEEENLFEIREEFEKLTTHHWKEVAVDQDRYPLNIHWHAFAQQDKAGRLVTVTVRRAGRLVGYALFVIAKRMHYKDSVSGQCDAFWLDPAERGHRMGTLLIMQSEEILKERGVDIVYNRSKLHGNLDLDRFFTSMGYTAIERVYKKVID